VLGRERGALLLDEQGVAGLFVTSSGAVWATPGLPRAAT
jgi:hypothetical protein